MEKETENTQVENFPSVGTISHTNFECYITWFISGLTLAYSMEILTMRHHNETFTNNRALEHWIQKENHFASTYKIITKNYWSSPHTVVLQEYTVSITGYNCKVYIYINDTQLTRKYM